MRKASEVESQATNEQRPATTGTKNLEPEAIDEEEDKNFECKHLQII